MSALTLQRNPLQTDQAPVGGWIYVAPGHGTWVNACDISEQDNTACPGNAGDIV